jgi:hypothetical protein
MIKVLVHLSFDESIVHKFNIFNEGSFGDIYLIDTPLNFHHFRGKKKKIN